MFDMLTEDETRALDDKLFSAGRKFADVSHALAGVSLANRGQLGFSWDDPIWQQRNRYNEAMSEMHALRAAR